MEGYTVSYKYQTEAAIHIFRWSPEHTQQVWSLLSNCIDAGKNNSPAAPSDPISIALILKREKNTTFLDLAEKFGEKQLWALMITKAEPETTPLDRLSDARDQIHRIIAQDDFARQRHLHANFNYGTAERNRQTAKSKLPRGKIGETHKATSTAEIISNLANENEYTEYSAKELWPHFLAALDELDLDPQVNPNFPEWKDLRCSYDYKDGRKTMTFGRFASRVSECRNKAPPEKSC